MTRSREPDPDRIYDTESAFDTTEPGEHTVPVERAPRSARTAAPARPLPDVVGDDTIIVERAGRRRAAAAGAQDPDLGVAPAGVAEPARPDAWAEGDAPDDDTVARGRLDDDEEDLESAVRVRREHAAPDAGGVAVEAAWPAAPDPAPGGREAYSPDPAELRQGYAARPVAPFIAERAPLPLRMAQPPADGEAVDRAIRGRARRRVAWLGAALAFAVVSAGCLLTALIATFAH